MNCANKLHKMCGKYRVVIYLSVIYRTILIKLFLKTNVLHAYQLSGLLVVCY